MLKTLKTQHRTIIQMSFNGFKNQEIAERLSMSQSTISGILRSPLGEAYLGGLHDKSKENTLDVRKHLISMNSDALAAFERILSPAGKAPYAVQCTVAKDILDRNGFKPTDKINIDMTLQAKSDEEIAAEITALTESIARSAVAALVPELDNEEESSRAPANRNSPITTIPHAPTHSLEDSSSVSIETSSSELDNASVDTFPPK